ncbi:MAG: alpha/beta hydrolase fold domain-containing protein [Planctomycetota bacterium]|nr:alpha/beta hydrolase fold domain-containing protein [Planctomycetota bacterium]
MLPQIRPFILAITCAIFCWVPDLLCAQQPDKNFQQWDRNRDGRLVVQELPEKLRPNFPRVDQNQDGFISLEEHLRFIGRRRPAPDSPKRSKYQSLRDIPYVTEGHPRQKLDLHLPAGKPADRWPLLIFVHGGAWKGGDKRSAPIEEFIDRGFAVASLNYRLSQHAIYPAQIEDCQAAVRWLRDHAGEYQIDPHRFGAFGKSAGGHLVCLLGTRGERATPGTNISSRVQAVCSWYGPTELLSMNRQSGPDSQIDHDAENSPESRLVGGPLQENSELARAASPLHHVTADDAPFLLMHGKRDRLVPWQQSEKLHQKLESAGISSELMIIEGAGHGFDHRQQLPGVIQFFEQQLIKEPATNRPEQ